MVLTDLSEEQQYLFENDRYKVEIAALSETRLAEEGLLKEVGAGYTFFWSACKKDERREAGVGFAIKSHLVIKDFQKA